MARGVFLVVLVAASVLLGVLYRDPMTPGCMDMIKYTGYQSTSVPYLAVLIELLLDMWGKVVEFVHRNRLCCTLHRKLGPLLQHLRIVLYYLKPFAQQASSSFNDGFAILRGNLDFSRIDEGYSMLSLINNGRNVIESDEEDEDEEDGDEKSTKNKKQSKNKEQPESSNVDAIVDAVLNDPTDVTLHKDTDDSAVQFPQLSELINTEVLLQEGGFNIWVKSISRKFKAIENELSQEVDNTISSTVVSGVENFQKDIEELRSDMDAQISILKDTVQNINCTMIYDENTDSVFYYDHTGQKLLDTYVTRPLIMHHLKSTETRLEQLVEAVKLQVENMVEQSHIALEAVRNETIEAYEEWGDTFYTEWSKYMAYRDIYDEDGEEPRPLAIDGKGKGEDQGDDEVAKIYEDWFEFTLHKKDIIQFRDQLLHKQLDTKKLKQFETSLDSQLDSLEKTYTAQIQSLRSQADRLLKDRDHKEAQMFKQ